ncbi:ABC transporter substrate-binding protein [Alicyclobacillus shizuokensis]|uniref:ABC transporter substrate-binding protein n=1 Tax=Alicyclobacillus shizuokensis TaxID=392014 RepID=UPI0009F913CC|nr:peptide ABC transporter substrate-binding protein [Alicyclobacillus shizuokensis]MCL6625449.1 peptide ABC transporter substrate-binding protein [Alicyclobacillus shizuokensis]
MKRAGRGWWMIGSVVAAAAAAVEAAWHQAPSGAPKSKADSAVAVKASSPTRPRAGGSISLDVLAEKVDLDPASAFDPVSQPLVRQLYDQLVTYDADSHKVVPMAAQSWTVSKDGRTYTFHLRKGMHFWNGDAVTAQSFVDELKRVLNRKLKPHPCPAPSFFFTIDGAPEFYNGKSKSIAGVKVQSPYTLVFHLSKAQDDFLDILSLPFLSAVDEAGKPSLGHAMGLQMGSGPFQPVRISAKRWVFRRNPHYWRTDRWGSHLPYLQEVVLHPVRDPDLAAIDYEQGLVAWIAPSLLADNRISPASWRSLKSHPALRSAAAVKPGDTVWYLGMNVKKKPFTDVDVRRAIAYAVDRTALARDSGSLTAATGLLPPETADQEGISAKLVPFDLGKAKSLVKQSGHGHRVRVSLWSSSGDGQSAIVSKIGQMLTEAGFEVKQRRVSFTKFLRAQETGQVGLFFEGWREDLPDADDFLELFQSDNPPALNPTQYHRTQIDHWLAAAESSASPQRRAQLYQKVSAKIIKDAVIVPIGYPLLQYVVQPEIHGFTAVPGIPTSWAQVWVERKSGSPARTGKPRHD